MDDTGFAKDFSLAAVMLRDRDLFEEVSLQYVDLFGIAVKVLDIEGNRLLEVNGATALCQYVYGIPKCRQACIEIVGGLRQHEPDFKTIDTTVCFSGAEYRVAPIHHETDVVGKVVLGPFLPDDVTGPPALFLDMDPAVKPEVAWSTTLQFRQLPRSQADHVAGTLALLIEAMCFVSHKGTITTDLHVESISEAYDELSRKNEELEAKVAELRSLDQQRTDFLSAVSQELKSPLTNVIGYAEMLREGAIGNVDNDQKEFLTTIIEEGEALLNVARTMEELAAVEEGRLELHPSDVVIDDLLEQVTTYGRRLGAPKGVAVDLDESASGMPPAWLDEERIRSALERLVDNAVKFTPAGGRVQLSARMQLAERESGPAVMLALKVQDTGIGIENPHQDHLFEPFYVVHRGPEREYAGTGVGLTVARAYVEAHGGRIVVDSAPGVGSAFTVLVPVEAE